MKKNKKGFTLVELLAIIVILAIIAVITVPIVLNVIENAKKGAAINSALGYKDAIQKYYASKLFDDNGFKLQGEFDIDNNGAISNDLENHPIAFSGTIPSGGYATIENGKLISGCVQINEYAVNFENGSVTQTIKGTCGNTSVEVAVETFPQVTDANPGIICGDDETEDYDNSSECYIYSVEDLVAFSAMVNSGKNFTSKTVHLMNNLDIENDVSYANVNTNQFNDLNEDGTVSTTLKEELTTGKGFNPIGNNTYKFAGTFEGNVHTLKSLYINRNSTDYVGLFGYSTGKIRGLKVTEAEITGNEYVGIIAGRTEGRITSLIIKGNVNGYRYLGLASGYVRSTTVEAITSGNVSSTHNVQGEDSLTGGIVGYFYTGSVRGTYLGGTVSTQGGNAYKAIGRYAGSPTIKVAVASTVTAPSADEGIAAKGGYTMNTADLDNIAIINATLDTYAGGDNDQDNYADGYYYDYDVNGKVTIFKISERPLNITMSGSGTSADPYLITNYDELRQASYNLGNASSGKYYQLTADINLAGKKSVMIGNDSSKFLGTFDGNGHTISNLTLAGHDYIGLFGYNEGTIKGLRVIDANVSGHQYVGIITGRTDGKTTGLVIKGNVNGYRYLGLASGYVRSTTVEAMVEGNVTSTHNVQGEDSLTGGIVGYFYTGKVNGIYLGGTVSTQGGNAYKAIGSIDGSTTIRTITASTVTAPSVDDGFAAKNGQSAPVSGMDNIAMYEAVLDTYIGGDKDRDSYSDGYYYDYDETGNFTVFKLSERPLTITMAGEGTSANPYKITNYNELKQVSYNLGDASTGKYYRLDSDINLSEQKAIMIGDDYNMFKGTFDGNAHTINNLTLLGYNYVGLFGYNGGTVKGLTVTESNVSGYQYIGIIAGRTDKPINCAIAKGNVSGYQYLGLATGYIRNTTVEAVVQGNVSSIYNAASTNAKAGGIVGYFYTGTVRGMYLGGAVTTQGANAYKTIGEFAGSPTSTTGVSETVTAQNEDNGIGNKGGKVYTTSELQTLAPYQEVILNTSSTGEYRYALDSNYNPYIVKN